MLRVSCRTEIGPRGSVTCKFSMWLKIIQKGLFDLGKDSLLGPDVSTRVQQSQKVQDL